MNNAKPRWRIFLAWTFVGAAFVVSILGILTIGKFVFPFAFLGLYFVLKWGGDRKRNLGELDRSTPIAHPLDLPIEFGVCKLVACGAAMWTILGASVAISGLSNVDAKARPYFIAIIFLATIVGISATVFALQGKRRRAILALFASIIFPTYFLWVLSLIPVVLASFLLLSPFATPFRDPAVRRRIIRSLSYLGIAIIVFFAWWVYHVDPNASTESKRVQAAFEQMFLTVTKREGVPTPWLVPMHVDRTSYSDGSKASLWVPLPSPEGVRSNCFYVDEPSKGGATGYVDALCMKPTEGWVCTSSNRGTCFQPGKSVNLERNGSVVVGSVGLFAADKVSVTAKGKTVELRVRYGYFIIPGSMSEAMTTKFAITLLDKTGAPLGTVTSFQASGWGTPR